MKVSEYSTSEDKTWKIFRDGDDERTSYAKAVLYTNTDKTNCKLSYLHGIGSLANFTEQDIKQVIDGILVHLKGTVLINTTSKRIAGVLEKLYKCYYSNEVPIGYGNDYQYHILIKNEINPNNYCRNPKPIKHINKDVIKDTLLKTLRKLRRKNDYVESFIENLQV